jgi:hypothetical protein
MNGWMQVFEFKASIFPSKIARVKLIEIYFLTANSFELIFEQSYVHMNASTYEIALDQIPRTNVRRNCIKVQHLKQHGRLG